MKIGCYSSVTGGVLGLLLLGAGVRNCPADPALPAPVPINRDAGRGNLLIVTVTLESGEQLPFIVDTGAGRSLIDRSLESKLGQPIGTALCQSWGRVYTNNVYQAPKLLLGGVPLEITDSAIIAFDCQKDSPVASVHNMGVLGMDVWEHYCVQLDFPAGKMRFLDARQSNKTNWGRAFPIVPLNDQDPRPAVAGNLLGQLEPHTLIDSGCNYDGWLRAKPYEQWTNRAVAPAPGEARTPNGLFHGQKYPLVFIERQDVEADGIGLRFLARHLVTLDFPEHTLYLRRQSSGPLFESGLKSTPMPALNDLVAAVLEEDGPATRRELRRIEQGRDNRQEKRVARKLAATLDASPRPTPAEIATNIDRIALGDCRPETATVGWLEPQANRIPLNSQIASPLLDSGNIYATGLYAHPPSRYVFQLGGKWRRLRGTAGLLTAFQFYAPGVVFVLRADGREIFSSGAIRGSQHADYDVKIAGAQTLELIVEQAQEGNGGDWALWLEPQLVR